MVSPWMQKQKLILHSFSIKWESSGRGIICEASHGEIKTTNINQKMQYNEEKDKFSELNDLGSAVKQML